MSGPSDGDGTEGRSTGPAAGQPTGPAAGDPPPLLDGDRLPSLCDRVAAAGAVLLCLDFDGTLAPIVDDPDEATMPDSTAASVARLATAPAVTVGIVSGRALDDLRHRAPLVGVRYAGNHGLEWDHGDGRTVAPDARERRPALERAIAAVRAALGAVPGCRIEDKGLTATVHYRETPADRRSRVAETVERIAAETEGVRCSAGRMIRELRPDVPAGKDRAVDHLRERHPDALPVFVGDDVTDEDGFRAVADDGVGVLVGDRVDTTATLRVRDPAGVGRLLDRLVAVLVP
jgi:trehalose 6-phosphate phosphatase